MQTGKTPTFTWKQAVISIAVGLLFILLQKHYVPEKDQSAFNRSSAQWGIVFLSLAGGYILFKERDNDVNYYREKMPQTEEVEGTLQKRRRNLGYVGTALIALGSIYLVVLLVRLLDS